MSMYETNMKRIHRRIDAGLAMLREAYRVTEIDTGSLENFVVAGRYHAVKQYEIEGVGNLLVMTNPREGAMQMDTFTITPYYKNLPLFTTDYMYFEDKRMFLNEIYDLVEEQDALYREYIAKFAENCAAVADLENMPMKPCWYDDIRPVFAGKTAAPEEDDRICELFLKNLATFIEMEQNTPLLPPEKRQGKWLQNFNYARALVEDGGVSTDLFVQSLGADETKRFFYSVFFAPYRYRPDSNDRLASFLDLKDENGQTNHRKISEKQKVIRRVAETDKSKSFEETNTTETFNGIVTEGGKTVGFGIHIFNEDVYPLQSFEIYLRGCELSGCLDLDGQKDMVFLDVYHNRISSVRSGALPSMRIFGVQDNMLESIDASQMPACQGIDAGMNRLHAIDVSKNPELVELYINDNDFTEIDLSANPKLKYFYCHNNRITRLDTRNNPLLRHLNATGNPMKEIISLAPQQNERLPLALYAEHGGSVGLKFNPVYNAQWKETGEWQQSYYAYPDEGYRFVGWQDDHGNIVSNDAVWIDTYGSSRMLKAIFER
ncbi:MAG: hypothetical protein KBS74_01255 [Clostridiales bacterium]|nr:hypothetical protein [Candidatus Cacconaster stercorequi]